MLPSIDRMLTHPLPWLLGSIIPMQSSCFVAGMQLVLTKKLLKTSKPNETLQALNRRPSRRSTQKWTLLSVTVQSATVLGAVAFLINLSL